MRTMTGRRRLAYLAASLISAAGMMSGHALAGALRAGGAESPWPTIIGLMAWVVAGIVAVLIDHTVPSRAVGFASLALPLIWFGMLLVAEDRALWMLGLAALALFSLLAAVSALATKWVLVRMWRP